MTSRKLSVFGIAGVAFNPFSTALAAPPHPTLSSWMLGILTVLLLAIAALFIGWRRTRLLKAPRRGAAEPASRLALLSMLPLWRVLVPQAATPAHPAPSKSARNAGEKTGSALARKRESVADR